MIEEEIAIGQQTIYENEKSDDGCLVNILDPIEELGD